MSQLLLSPGYFDPTARLTLTEQLIGIRIGRAEQSSVAGQPVGVMWQQAGVGNAAWAEMAIAVATPGLGEPAPLVVAARSIATEMQTASSDPTLTTLTLARGIERGQDVFLLLVAQNGSDAPQMVASSVVDPLRHGLISVCEFPFRPSEHLGETVSLMPTGAVHPPIATVVLY